MRPRSRLARTAVLALLLVIASPLLTTLVLRLPSSFRLDVGPGDGDYVQGLHQDWRWEAGAT